MKLYHALFTASRTDACNVSVHVPLESTGEYIISFDPLSQFVQFIWRNVFVKLVVLHIVKEQLPFRVVFSIGTCEVEAPNLEVEWQHSFLI